MKNAAISAQVYSMPVSPLVLSALTEGVTGMPDYPNLPTTEREDVGENGINDQKSVGLQNIRRFTLHHHLAGGLQQIKLSDFIPNQTIYPF